MKAIRSNIKFIAKANRAVKETIYISYESYTINTSGYIVLNVIHYTKKEEVVGQSLQEGKVLDVIGFVNKTHYKTKRVISFEDAKLLELSLGLTQENNSIDSSNKMILHAILNDVKTYKGETDQLAYNSQPENWEII